MLFKIQISPACHTSANTHFWINVTWINSITNLNYNLEGSQYVRQNRQFTTGCYCWAYWKEEIGNYNLTSIFNLLISIGISQLIMPKLFQYLYPWILESVCRLSPPAIPTTLEIPVFQNWIHKKMNCETSTDWFNYFDAQYVF